MAIGQSPLAAKVVSTAIGLVLNFVGRRFIVFPEKQNPDWSRRTRGRRDSVTASRMLVSPVRNSLTFSGRAIPPGGFAPPLHTPGMLGRRALPRGRRAPENVSPNFELGTPVS